MKILIALVVAALSALAQDVFAKKIVAKPERLSMVAVWDLPGHTSTPDLLRYDNRWLIAFRKASAADHKDGSIQVMSSLDGSQWSSAAHLDHPIADLDHPRLHAMPNGQLLLTAAVTMHTDGPNKYRTYAWLSWNGREWDGPRMIGEEGIHLGPMEWRRGKAYGFGYQPGAKERTLRGFISEADLELSEESPAAAESAHLGQTGIAFLPDDTALAVANHVDGNLRYGVSRPPYRHWQWKDLTQKVADPRLLRLEDGRLLVSGADAKGRSSIFWLDALDGSLTQASALSAEATFEGASVRWFDGALWAAYRAANPNGAASIYVARIKLP